MKIISIIRHLSTALRSSDDEIERKAGWMRDPLSHPVIDAMSERELADLPFAHAPRRGKSGKACPA